MSKPPPVANTGSFEIDEVAVPSRRLGDQMQDCEDGKDERIKFESDSEMFLEPKISKQWAVNATLHVPQVSNNVFMSAKKVQGQKLFHMKLPAFAI